MSVSIVIPVYNEEDNILPLAKELMALNNHLECLEILFIDDGSADATWERIKSCASSSPCIHGLHYDQNRGQSSAMLIGLSKAAGDIIVTMDGDAQNNPADIPKLTEKIGKFDVVCGYRAVRKDSWSRRAGSRLANKVRNMITQDNIRDTGCSLKAFKKECIKDLPHIEGVHRFMPAYFKINGRSITEIPVDHRARTKGTSKYTNMKRLPRTVYDLFGFAWYRKRHLRSMRNEDIESTGTNN